MSAMAKRRDPDMCECGHILAAHGPKGFDCDGGPSGPMLKKPCACREFSTSRAASLPSHRPGETNVSNIMRELTDAMVEAGARSLFVPYTSRREDGYSRFFATYEEALEGDELHVKQLREKSRRALAAAIAAGA